VHDDDDMTTVPIAVFPGDTDDMREAPSIALITALEDIGSRVWPGWHTKAAHANVTAVRVPGYRPT
jgi:hypothetical protein